MGSKVKAFLVSFGGVTLAFGTGALCAGGVNATAVAMVGCGVVALVVSWVTAGRALP